MPLALSVQLFDDRSWLVAIYTHETQGLTRDIYIENVDFAFGITKYFDRIWAESSVGA